MHSVVLGSKRCFPLIELAYSWTVRGEMGIRMACTDGADA